MRLIASLAIAAAVHGQSRLEVPRAWDSKALADWATPVAGLNVRPGHFSEEEYYRAPVDNLRTYPVYYPGREPEGYWDMVRKAGPKPLIEPESLQTKADWIRAGKRVFEEYDVPAFRTLDAKLIAAARSTEAFAKSKVKPRPNGTLPDLRWVPTAAGVALGLANCSGCHERLMADGTIVHGPAFNEEGSPMVGGLARWGSSTVRLPGDSPGMAFWRSFAVPWIKDDIHESFKIKPFPELRPVLAAAFAEGLFPRWNGSAYYPTKVLDLIGLKDRKYIDHSATHRHRGPGDIMRYAAMVTYSDISDFGPHRLLTDEQRKVSVRLPDEALYAMALYIYSLEPPPNPNRLDARAATGKKVFEHEGCGGCHTPPLYTNNKLTLATGFTPPKEHFKTLDIIPMSVGTDPGLAMRTRKGTGYYKVPSLKGVWYRSHFLHDGALTRLEEMFDPARLAGDYVPSGFRIGGTKTRAVKGHEFGIKLAAEEKAALVAFLRTL